MRTDLPATLIVYAPPHSLGAVLADAADVLGSNRRCALARELTKVLDPIG
jgi:16S rRNA (cytidine1402-2'-O)-methyltransferase